MKYSESNPPLQCLMTHSTCYQSTGTMNPIGFVIHSTGANNPNLKRYVQPYYGDQGYDYLINYLGYNASGNDWNHTYVEAGVNAWIGKAANGEITTVQTLGWQQAPWGTGQGWTGYSLNNLYIQVEICEDGLNDYNYFLQTYNEACDLVAYLAVKYGWDVLGTNYLYGYNIPVVTSHYEAYNLGWATGHVDPDGHWWNRFGVTMDDFRNDVYKTIQSGYEQEEEELDQNTFNQMMNTYLSELATKPVDDWAKEAMEWAKNEGIYVGDGNSLMPRKFLTREEFAAVLQRVLEEGKGV